MVELPWLLLQLVGYVVAMVVLVVGFAFVALAPPYWAGRYLWRHLRT